MTSEQWQLAKDLYGVVSAMATQERQLFLRAAEADDEVRAMVERMVAHRDQMQDFLTHSPLPDKTVEPNAVTQAVGHKIGAYILKRKLGTGGMGVVYLGVRDDDAFEKDVAIKLLWRGFPDDEARFQRERKILAQLNHPHITQLLDGGITPEGWQYIVMEYIEGLPITEYCEQHQLTVPERVQLFQSVCAAVQYAHQNMVIHRDLKPGNILVTRDGVVKLLDFGIAKLVTPESEGELLSSLPGNWMMTPEYASPEQLAKQQVSTISDVYSLGVVLYELLTGKRPYQFLTRSPLEAARRIAESPPPLPSTIHTPPKPKELSRSLRGDLDNIALKALQYEPGQRYASATQLRDDLTRYLHGQPVLARKPTMLYLTNRFLRRHKYTVLMGALALLVLSVWLGSAFWQMAGERTQVRLQRRKLYAAQMQQAWQSWQAEDFLRTKKTVAQWLPHDDEEDLRGFEWHYLQRLVNPSELTVTMPDEVVEAWHLPDTQQLYVRDVSGQRKVFDAVTGQERWSYQDQTETRVTPDWPLNGEVLALEDGNRVVIWNIVQGRKKAEFIEATAPLKLVSQLDETRLFTIDAQGIVRIRERATGKLLREIAGTGRPFTSCWFIGPSNALALISGERTVTVQDLAGNRPVFSFTEAQNIKGLSPDRPRQRFLVHVGDEVVVRDANNGRHLQTLHLAEGTITRVGQFGSSHLLFLARNDYAIQILDANNLRQLGVLQGHQGEVSFQEFRPELNWLVTISSDHTARIWDVAQQKEVVTFRGHASDVTTALLSQDRQKLITGSRDHTARIWDVAQARQPNLLKGHTDHILTAAFSPDNQHIATAGKDSLAIISDIQNGTQRTLRGHGAMIFTVAFAPDGKRLATGSNDGTAKLWDTLTGQEIATIRNGTREYVDGVRTLTFTRDGQRLIAGCNDGWIKIWDVRSGQLLSQFRAHASEVLSVSLSPDGHRLASSGWDRQAKLWDATTWQELAVLKGHQGQVWSAEFSPDGAHLATSSSDHTIKLWNIATAQLLRTLEGHNDEVFSLSFTPDGKRLASGSNDKTVRLWNPATGEELLTLRDHRDEVWRVAFSSDGATLLSASWDKTARLYRTAHKTPPPTPARQ